MGKKIQFFSKSESHKDDDGRFIDAVLNESYRTVTGIIEEYEKNIKKMVLAKFKNSSLNYMDVFQEGFIILIENINAGKFKGESSVMTYLNVICFRNCLFHLKKSSKVVYTDSDRDLDSTEDFNFIKQLRQIWCEHGKLQLIFLDIVSKHTGHSILRLKLILKYNFKIFRYTALHF